MEGRSRSRRRAWLGIVPLIVLTALLFAAAAAVPGAGVGGTESIRSACPFCLRDFQQRSSPSVGLLVQCPGCGSIVDVWQPDTDGSLHRPPWFLRLEPPPRSASPALLWNWVRRNIRYVRDGQDVNAPEAWQLARQTYEWRRGDCEDSAILLADWLRAAGFDAYVVAGRARLRAHAWVIVHLDDGTYLLETTGDRSAGGRRFPPRADLMVDYNPTGFMFDDSEVWVRRGKRWTADYRSAGRWYRIPQPR